MTRLTERFKKHLAKGTPAKLSPTVLQTWWVVEKCVEGPESSNVFCDVVGVLRNKAEKLDMPYRQKKALVLTESINSRTGIALDFKPQISLGGLHRLYLCPIDFKYEVFPGWD